jgi:flagellar biosynthesis anti-sigma factor FlgM
MPAMMNPIKLGQTGLSGIGAARSAPVTAPADGAKTASPQPQAMTGLSDLPRRIAAEGPPMNAERVGELRAAIADGSYRPDPATIAAAMLEAERSA